MQCWEFYRILASFRRTNIYSPIYNTLKLAYFDDYI